MRFSSYHILRVGIGITFVWLGLLIIQDPSSWGSYMQSWAIDLLPIEIDQAMMIVGVFDVIIGVWLITALSIFIPAILAALHIAGVLIVTTGSLQATIVRDIGLLGASIALAMEARKGN